MNRYKKVSFSGFLLIIICLNVTGVLSYTQTETPADWLYSSGIPQTSYDKSLWNVLSTNNNEYGFTGGRGNHLMRIDVDGIDGFENDHSDIYQINILVRVTMESQDGNAVFEDMEMKFKVGGTWGDTHVIESDPEDSNEYDLTLILDDGTDQFYSNILGGDDVEAVQVTCQVYVNFPWWWVSYLEIDEIEVKYYWS